jgi:hypothetical protein
MRRRRSGLRNRSDSVPYCRLPVMSAFVILNCYLDLRNLVLTPRIVQYAENDQQNALDYILLFISCDGAYMFRQ